MLNENILWFIFFLSIGFLIGFNSNNIQLYCSKDNTIESIIVTPNEYVRMVEHKKTPVGYVYENKTIDSSQCKSSK